MKMVNQNQLVALPISRINNGNKKLVSPRFQRHFDHFNSCLGYTLPLLLAFVLDHNIC